MTQELLAKKLSRPHWIGRRVIATHCDDTALLSRSRKDTPTCKRCYGTIWKIHFHSSHRRILLKYKEMVKFLTSIHVYRPLIRYPKLTSSSFICSLFRTVPFPMFPFQCCIGKRSVDLPDIWSLHPFYKYMWNRLYYKHNSNIPCTFLQTNNTKQEEEDEEEKKAPLSSVFGLMFFYFEFFYSLSPSFHCAVRPRKNEGNNTKCFCCFFFLLYIYCMLELDKTGERGCVSVHT